MAWAHYSYFESDALKAKLVFKSRFFTKTVPLTARHARSVAALHIRGINTGFISSLGLDFVTALYEAIAQSASSFGFAVEDNDKVLGFVAFTTNLSRLYKSIIAKRGWRFALLLAGKMFSLKKIRKVSETLFYPSRVKKMDLPDAELLSIAVDPEKYHNGLATELVRKSLEHCRRIGLDKVKVLVAAANKPANKLYRKCGFKLVGQIDNHGVTSNIYQAATDTALLQHSVCKNSEPSIQPIRSEKAHPVLPPLEPVAIGFFATPRPKLHRKRSA